MNNINNSLESRDATSRQYNYIFKAAILSLFCYVFFSDFAYAVFHLGFLKPISALCTVLFAGSFFMLDWRNIRYKPFLLVSFILTIFYIGVLHNKSPNYMYTPIFGILMIQRPDISRKYLDKVFVIQLLLLAVEFATRHHLYTQLTTGLFTIQELDHDYETMFEETGFRAKGLFAGVLVSSCFAINYSLLNSNNYLKSFLSLVMAIFTNGRLAMLICGAIFLYKIYLKRNKNSIKFNKAYLVWMVVLLILFIVVLVSAAESTAVQNFIDVFNFESDSNQGRMIRYGLGMEALMNYKPLELAFGSTYELFDQWNRSVPPESDIVGMLLEIGIIGLLYVLWGLIRAWLSDNTALLMPNIVSSKFVLALSFVAMIQYRHLSGNVRGLMFWFLVYMIIDNKFLKVNKNG